MNNNFYIEVNGNPYCHRSTLMEAIAKFNEAVKSNQDRKVVLFINDYIEMEYFPPPTFALVLTKDEIELLLEILDDTYCGIDCLILKVKTLLENANARS